MDENKKLLAYSGQTHAFRFGSSPQNHTRKDSETEKLTTRKTESTNYINLISPRDTLCCETGVSRLNSPKTQSNDSLKVNKYKAFIKRLNSEIQILSLQLKQSNEIISHFTIKLNDISKNFIALKQITDELKLKVFKLENENSNLKLESKNLKKNHGGLMKKLENSGSSSKILETSNDSNLGFKVENWRGDYDGIAKMISSKIIQGIDEIIEKFKDDSDKQVDIERVKDFQGFISEECRSIIQKSLNM